MSWDLKENEKIAYKKRGGNQRKLVKWDFIEMRKIQHNVSLIHNLFKYL